MIFGNGGALASDQAREFAGTGSAMLGLGFSFSASIAAPLVGIAGTHSSLPMAIAMVVGCLISANVLRARGPGERNPEPACRSSVILPEVRDPRMVTIRRGGPCATRTTACWPAGRPTAPSAAEIESELVHDLRRGTARWEAPRMMRRAAQRRRGACWGNRRRPYGSVCGIRPTREVLTARRRCRVVTCTYTATLQVRRMSGRASGERHPRATLRPYSQHSVLHA